MDTNNPFDEKLPYRFEFTFLFLNEETDEFDTVMKYFLFLIPDEETLQRIRWSDDVSDDHMDFLNEVSAKYGDHGINMDNDAILDGYDSDEVEPDQADKLMEKWRKFYIGQGFQVGPVVTMTEQEYEEKFPNDD